MFVIELGENENGPLDENEKPTKVWRSDGFYNLYAFDGPVVVKDKSEAYRFDDRGKASNVIGGDVRLKGSRIVDA